jgi:hypothetical protein
VLPTLLPGLVELQEKLEKTDFKDIEGKLDPCPVINPIRWLAEYLVRHHPQSNDEISLTKPKPGNQLSMAAAILKTQRQEREKKQLELSDKIRSEEAQRDMDAVRLETEKRKNQQEAHIRNVEIKDQERNKRGEKLAVAAIGFSKASLILAFRNQCMSMVNDFNYAEAFLSNNQPSKLISSLYQDACRFLLTNSAATFVAAVSLIDADTLLYHTIANRRDRPSDGESEDTGLVFTIFQRSSKN